MSSGGLVGLVGTAIGMLAALILSVSAFEFGQETINFKNQKELIAQLVAVQHAMTSYGGSICGIQGGATGFTCSSSPTWGGLKSGGYLPSGFTFPPLVSGSPNLSIYGQSLWLSLSVSSASVCNAASVAIEESSCSGNTLNIYAPIITGTVWGLVGTGQFVYP